MQIENTPENEKNHPRSIASIRRANASEIRDEDTLNSNRIENHPTSIANLSSSASKIDLVCAWRAILGQEVVRGEQYLRGIPIHPQTFCQGCPIIATVDHAASPILHDFSLLGPALVNMVVTLKNRMLETSVKFTLCWEPLSTFELIGTTEQTLELDGNEDVAIPFQALIQRTGIYNLQVLRFDVQPHEQQPQQDETNATSYHLSQQWLIHLVDHPCQSD